MSEIFAAKLLERNRVGALIRVFAHKEELVEPVANSAISAVRRLLSLRTGGRPTFSRIDLLVSSDPEFHDSDCGVTAQYLRKEIDRHFPDVSVNVLEIKRGDIYCMLLNYGIVNQLEDRIPYSLILSHGVASYATQENVDALLAAIYHRARVAGIAIEEIASFVERGRIANTFAIWHNKSLMTVGGFDLRAAKPTKERGEIHERVGGWSQTKALRYGDGSVTYHVAGCEEIIPLIRLVRFFGPSIAIVKPGKDDMSWKTFEDISPDIHLRHLAKLATKEARQERFASSQGVSLDFLEQGIIKEPPLFA